jgi:hypothetical protein
MASVAPLESGVATFQGSPQQREKRSHRTHIDPRQHEPRLLRLQAGPQMNGMCQRLEATVRRNPVAREMMTEHLPSGNRGHVKHASKLPVNRRFGQTGNLPHGSPQANHNPSTNAGAFTRSRSRRYLIGLPIAAACSSSVPNMVSRSNSYRFFRNVLGPCTEIA